MQGDDAEAEARLQKAVEMVRRQSAKSWEPRPATSLARLWQKQGRIEEARRVGPPGAECGGLRAGQQCKIG
jgi:predicted ATPase